MEKYRVYYKKKTVEHFSVVVDAESEDDAMLTLNSGRCLHLPKTPDEMSENYVDFEAMEVEKI